MNSVKVKEHAYKAIVRPKLECASTIWDPHAKNHTSQIEKVQRRAAGFVTNRYHNTSSVSEMLQTLNWPPLMYYHYVVKTTPLVWTSFSTIFL